MNREKGHPAVRAFFTAICAIIGIAACLMLAVSFTIYDIDKSGSIERFITEVCDPSDIVIGGTQKAETTAAKAVETTKAEETTEAATDASEEELSVSDDSTSEELTTSETSVDKPETFTAEDLASDEKLAEKAVDIINENETIAKYIEKAIGKTEITAEKIELLLKDPSIRKVIAEYAQEYVDYLADGDAAEKNTSFTPEKIKETIKQNEDKILEYTGYQVEESDYREIDEYLSENPEVLDAVKPAQVIAIDDFYLRLIRIATENWFMAIEAGVFLISVLMIILINSRVKPVLITVSLMTLASGGVLWFALLLKNFLLSLADFPNAELKSFAESAVNEIAAGSIMKSAIILSSIGAALLVAFIVSCIVIQDRRN